MKAIFVELPAFERDRQQHLSDDAYRAFQNVLMHNPEAGDVIEGTGGLRKVRVADPRRGKGKRGGLRVIYFWWQPGSQYWLFGIYDKDSTVDLTPKQRDLLKRGIKHELEARR